ncbi:C40 family peptidase [Chlamydia avium]|uniref:NlpC/P60 family protein n=1 Tax=Chlamydia avium 10DC88 TaxID=1229831 RepID=W8JF94_9CHLA|nr:NlpC/P60 family protein [Chlamydia avium]AHK63211.1 NlpC/P60 family protein [Chlamydia avium 10DC88]
MQYHQLHSSVSDLLSIDGKLETQLLFGERFLYNKEKKCYAYSQIVYDQFCDVWRPYPGYISKELNLFATSFIAPNAVVKTLNAFLEPWHLPLPYGSPLFVDTSGKVCLPKNSLSLLDGEVFCDLKHLRFLNEPFSLANLLKESELFLDFPYLWGGRCVHDCFPNYGVDCSGLIHILFQANGWSIPRNSRDQYRDCIFIDSFQNLPLGGCVFLQEDDEPHISHIMLKTGSKLLIHALQSLGKIIHFEIGKDGEFTKDRFYFHKKEGKAFFGVPKKRKAFF